MTTEKKMIEVKIKRKNVYHAGKQLDIGVHSVSEAVANRWLKSGVAILPKDELQERDYAKEIAALEAKVKSLESELKAAKKK